MTKTNTHPLISNPNWMAHHSACQCSMSGLSDDQEGSFAFVMVLQFPILLSPSSVVFCLFLASHSLCSPPTSPDYLILSLGLSSIIVQNSMQHVYLCVCLPSPRIGFSSCVFLSVFSVSPFFQSLLSSDATSFVFDFGSCSLYDFRAYVDEARVGLHHIFSPLSCYVWCWWRLLYSLPAAP